MLKKTKIDWCDCTLNPVVGCPRGCEYCYARKQNDRFKWVADWTKPQFFPERLEALKSKKSKSIFMDSMSDIEFWRESDVRETINLIKKYPQHIYLFLTKSWHVPYNLFFYHVFEQNKQNKSTINQKTDDAIIGQNVFIGRTITGNTQFTFTDNYNFDFLSAEPILEKIDLNLQSGKQLKLIIIGAETGNRKGKVIPKKEWIDSLVKQADDNKISVFMKESLREIMGSDFRQDKLPWQK